MRKKIAYSGLALLVCLGYYALLVYFQVGIPCIFYKVTGLMCPGCGVTRMVRSIIALDFSSAFHYNPVVFVTSPILLYFVGKSYLCWLFNKKQKERLWEKVLLYLVIVLLLGYGILRNIPIAKSWFV